ncbi:hypothetical protein SSS_06412 [Sarcoptes scabiei]|uniref:Uncharacterized protein n=1 Tax=Sarcoptes scabiei TaxID=52283 RepID=A0A834REZ9_SARSC|nr:hypothetical protein SSS_06412 [Sarcoptes scabiei]
MSEPPSRFDSFRRVAETFVSIDELKSQLIRLRAVNPEIIRMSSSRIAFFQAIERHLDHLKALLSSVEDSLLEKLRIDLFDGERSTFHMNQSNRSITTVMKCSYSVQEDVFQRSSSILTLSLPIRLLFQDLFKIADKITLKMSTEVPSDFPFEDILLSFNELLDKLGTLRRGYLSNHQLRSDHIQSMLGIESTLDHTRAVCVYADVSIRRNMFSSGSGEERNRLHRLLTTFRQANLVHHNSRLRLIRRIENFDLSDANSRRIREFFLEVQSLNTTTARSLKFLIPVTQLKKFLRLINKRSKSNSKMSDRNHNSSLETLNSSYEDLMTKLVLLRRLFLRNFDLPIEQIQWFMQIECYLEHLKIFLTFLDSSFRTQFFVVSRSNQRNRLIRLKTRFHRTNLAHHRSRMQIIHLLDEIDPSHTDYTSVRGFYSRVEHLVHETLRFYRGLLAQI